MIFEQMVKYKFIGIYLPYLGLSVDNDKDDQMIEKKKVHHVGLDLSYF